MAENSAFSPVTVVLDEDVEQWLTTVLDGRGDLAANGLAVEYFPDESLVRVQFAASNAHRSAATTISGRWIRGVPEESPSYPKDAVGPPALVIIVGDGGMGDGLAELGAYFFAGPGSDSIRCHLDVVRLESDLFSRVKGIFDSTILTPKTVGVVGLGSGGSVCALEMAKCGVGNFILVDFDRLGSQRLPPRLRSGGCGQVQDPGRPRRHLGAQSSGGGPLLRGRHL